MKTFEQKLDDYAKLITKIGLNIQKDQDFIITAPVSAVEFIRLIVKEAYSLGAKEIYYRWYDDELSLIRYNNAPDSVFDTFPKWMAEGYTELVKNGAAVLSVFVSDPELLKDVDPDKIKRDTITKSNTFKEYKDYVMNGSSNWCVVSVPSIPWAKSVYKDEKDSEAVSKLWDSIFEINRINTADPIQAWKDHFEKLEKFKIYLNEKQFAKLYYKGENTDLTVDLPKNHIWQGGCEHTTKGLVFAANIPTEEVFCMPYKYGVNGVLSSTMPLEYNGNIIDNFKFYFENGKIVSFEAEKGYATLENLLSSDEASRYLGEVAIVPVSSPIYKTGLIFYNTLYDENASCHFALGSAYPNCIENGENMTKEEREKAGVNDSIIHVDFMVGNDKLSIIGETESGEKISIFKNGEWDI